MSEPVHNGPTDDTQARGTDFSGDPEGGDEPEIQLLPLDAWHRANGGRMVPFAGYHMPVQYEGIMAEHLWVRESAGLFDVSHMGQLLFTGAGADRALEAVLPGDVTGLGAGRMRYSLLLGESGGILDDLMVTRLPGAGSFGLPPAHPFGGEPDPLALPEPDGEQPMLYMVVNGATKYDDIGALLDALPDAVTINLMDDQALLALQGPKAVDALARIVPGVEALVFMTAGAFEWQPERPLPHGAGWERGLSAGDALGETSPAPSPSPEGEGGRVPLWISRSGYTGEDGFEISIPAAHAAAFADALCAEPEVRPIGLGARDSLRLEAGLPLYGHDLDAETSPVSADLGFALSKRRREAGDFAGAARILAEREQGPVAKRVGLVVEGRQPVREGAAVVDEEGSEVGKVTSGGFAPTLGAPIAMAYVPAAMATEGTRLRLAQRGKLHWATVTPMPFVPHRYVRAGGK